MLDLCQLRLARHSTTHLCAPQRPQSRESKWSVIWVPTGLFDFNTVCQILLADSSRKFTSTGLVLKFVISNTAWDDSNKASAALEVYGQRMIDDSAMEEFLDIQIDKDFEEFIVYGEDVFKQTFDT